MSADEDPTPRELRLMEDRLRSRLEEATYQDQLTRLPNRTVAEQIVVLRRGRVACDELRPGRLGANELRALYEEKTRA